ncbi:MAG: hypothetical protein ACXVX8_19765 [Blastococcus sp.]
MDTALAIVLLLLAVGLTFFPMVDATKQGLPPWPWIVGGLVAGPLSGLVYLMVRRSLRMVAERDARA